MNIPRSLAYNHANGLTMRDIYYLPDGLKAGQIGDFETKIAQIQIFQGSQLIKYFWGLIPTAPTAEILDKSEIVVDISYEASLNCKDSK